MAENTAYFDSITSARAIADYDEQTALEGRQLISLEADADNQDSDAFVYIQENFSTFLHYLRYLKVNDQALVIAYYCLHKTQDQLGGLMGMTQTVVSFRIRMLIKVVCAFMVFGGIPNEGQIAEVLEAVGMERVDMPKGFKDSQTTPCSLSAIITLYVLTANFARVATMFSIHRAAIRRTMRLASERLMASTDDKQQLMGWWIHYLIDKPNQRKKKRKQGDIVRSDPDAVGQFRVQITEENADEVCNAVFTPHGSQ